MSYEEWTPVWVPFFQLVLFYYFGFILLVALCRSELRAVAVAKLKRSVLPLQNYLLIFIGFTIEHVKDSFRDHSLIVHFLLQKVEILTSVETLGLKLYVYKIFLGNSFA